MVLADGWGGLGALGSTGDTGEHWGAILALSTCASCTEVVFFFRDQTSNALINRQSGCDSKLISRYSNQRIKLFFSVTLLQPFAKSAEKTACLYQSSP